MFELARSRIELPGWLLDYLPLLKCGGVSVIGACAKVGRIGHIGLRFSTFWPCHADHLARGSIPRCQYRMVFISRVYVMKGRCLRTRHMSTLGLSSTPQSQQRRRMLLGQVHLLHNFVHNSVHTHATDCGESKHLLPSSALTVSIADVRVPFNQPPPHFAHTNAIPRQH
jgi:hypothetical protein